MVDADDAYGLRVVVQDMHGQPRTVDFNRAELARLGASEIRGRLLEAGLRVGGEGESVVVQVLKAAKPSDSIIVVSRPGWHRLPEPVFVTPAGDVIGAAKGIRIELSADLKLADRVSRRGTIEGWKGAIRAAISAKNCAHWILGAASAFAGVIVDLIGLNTCGLNESGRTSLGKTTAQQLAVSAWSSPKGSDGGLLKSMRTTENAVEALARDASGTILALDELAHCDGKMIGRMLYSLAGDQGKARMQQDSSLVRPHTWSTFALLSGEKSLEQKVRDDGGQWTGGMAVRFPDVDVSGVNPGVAPDTISAINQILNNYGHAGPAFVTKLVASGLHRQADLLRERVSAMGRMLASEDAEGAKIRAAHPFVILAIAGSLAQEFDLFPTEADVTGAIRWAWERFCESEDARMLNPDRQAITNIQQYIVERWDVTVKNVSAGAGIENREAVAWYDQNTVYLPINRAAEAAGHALGGQRIGAVLEKGGHLSRRLNLRRIAIRYVPKIGYVDCYALRRSQFGRSERETNRTQLQAVMGRD